MSNIESIGDIIEQTNEIISNSTNILEDNEEFNKEFLEIRSLHQY